MMTRWPAGGSDLPDIFEEKKALRKKMAERLKAFAATHSLADSSEAVRWQLLKSGLIEASDIVLGYLFHGNEADCSALLYYALEKGKETALPRVIPGTSCMDFYFLDGSLNFGDQIECGSFGISEPLSSLEKFEVSPQLAGKRILMIVPGLAFTKDGRRLGHGKGFYDRYIERLKKTGARITLAGFCFPCQLVSELPVDEHDLPMDMVFCG